MLEEQDRVVVPDGRRQQRLGVPRVDGATIFRPGTLWYQLAGFWEWIAPKLPPAPIAERTTSGTLACSLERYQYLADWLTRLSIERPRKSRT